MLLIVVLCGRECLGAVSGVLVAVLNCVWCCLGGWRGNYNGGFVYDDVVDCWDSDY